MQSETQHNQIQLFFSHLDHKNVICKEYLRYFKMLSIYFLLVERSDFNVVVLLNIFNVGVLNLSQFVLNLVARKSQSLSQL